jgi:hypothetical protein
MKGKRAINWKKKEKKISKKNGKKRKEKTEREGGAEGGREVGSEGKYRWKSGQARLAFCGFVL